MAEEIRFPSGFVWGAASSSHQAEGGNVHNDFDPQTFERRPRPSAYWLGAIARRNALRLDAETRCA